VRDMMVRRRAMAPERIVSIPTGCDTGVLRRRETTWSEIQERVPGLDEVSPQDRRILLVTRLDVDKRFIIDSVVDAWRSMAEEAVRDVAWVIAGDGTLRTALEAEAERLSSALGRRSVGFAGWVDDEARALLYSGSHLAVGPAGVPVEAMACETPVVALGRQRCEGLLDGANVFTAAYTNFGDYGQSRPRVRRGEVWGHIREVVKDDRALRRVAAPYRDHAVATFDQVKVIDKQLLRLWTMLSETTPRNATVRRSRLRDRVSRARRF
jgi:glycosyl transferase family 1